MDCEVVSDPAALPAINLIHSKTISHVFIPHNTQQVFALRLLLQVYAIRALNMLKINILPELHQ